MGGQTICIKKCFFQSLWSGWMGLNESGELPGLNLPSYEGGSDRNQGTGIVANDVNSQNFIVFPIDNYLNETINLTRDHSSWIGTEGKATYLYCLLSSRLFFSKTNGGNFRISKNTERNEVLFNVVIHAH